MNEKVAPDRNADVFICFSSKDEAIAEEIVESLEAAGLKCWISLRDLRPGENYQETIVEAIEKAKALVFLFSENSGASGEIKKELSLAASFNTHVFPVRLSPITPSGALRYELATRQWIDMFANREEALARLTETIRNTIDAGSVESASFRAAASGPDLNFAGVSQAIRPAGARAQPVLAADSSEFEAIRVALAYYIGPIARILVEKAAAKAHTRAELCEQLAEHVKSQSHREAFARAARTRLGVKD